MKRIITICAVLITAAPSLGQVVLYASAQGDSVRIEVIVNMNNFCEDPAGHSIIVEADLIGTCQEPFTVSPVPYPMPDYLTPGQFDFVIPVPDPMRYFRFRAVGIDPLGAPYPLSGGGDSRSYDFYGATDAVASRGHISSNSGDYQFEPCADSCWYTTWPGCPLWFDEAESGWEVFVDSGQLVNLYGAAQADGMPGAPCIIVSEVVPEYNEAGCAAVSAEGTSWGALKAKYR